MEQRFESGRSIARQKQQQQQQQEGEQQEVTKSKAHVSQQEVEHTVDANEWRKKVNIFNWQHEAQHQLKRYVAKPLL